MYNYIKRIIDFLISLIILPFLLILILLVGIAIKLDDHGSIFYMANRIGYNGKIFKMFKFRSMKENAPDLRYADGSTYNSEDDPRVTRVGKFLRKTSLDEVPQFLNVLIGDMAFIGPRPDSAFYLSEYTEEERVILNVRPGITGYNQAINRNAVGTKEKLQNDIVYVENMSFLFDVKIIFMTIKGVLFSKNVYRDKSNSEDIKGVLFPKEIYIDKTNSEDIKVRQGEK
ncbi:sugar transferase [Clostridium perfringens]|uniref:sugar transferase n=1 Tax=Clostridium perfringens TaxID=1502 RepID=UPI0004252CB4|nr:sugar transferase [Clostridium perfringens]MDB2059897.1 sugar transferase [Clostridium perfringens]MDB2062863.1 sugar transferase [Clostridium perfringens]MDK0571554.1 sugar transferase [Clostridium perfringens]MDK0629689.1 sugar transferase [Clostridium perfringens]MDM0542833.1 sugar transferase [Clostridium perfringens]